jgi:RNA polymerase sigma factor (sigma-70 family)
VDLGDNKARFAKVVMPYLDDAYGLARWVTGNSADAEDVVQEACLRAFRGIGGFSGGNSRAWVLTIVRNAAYDWLRKNRSPAVVHVEDVAAVEHMAVEHMANDAAAADSNPEAALIARADEARLEAAIANLPAVFRDTMVLRDVHGLDYREIAAITGVPIGTVMSRLARARRRVIEMLGAER